MLRALEHPASNCTGHSLSELEGWVDARLQVCSELQSTACCEARRAAELQAHGSLMLLTKRQASAGLGTLRPASCLVSSPPLAAIREAVNSEGDEQFAFSKNCANEQPGVHAIVPYARQTQGRSVHFKTNFFGDNGLYGTCTVLTLSFSSIKPLFSTRHSDAPSFPALQGVAES